ncbi:MAG: DUF4143 domain-containing protein [Coriobacteriia bacterium]|nr:DUF4143 domain-containing protein [Coriobacteriia bacterium]
MDYRNRIIDALIERHLKVSGAVLIRGPKGCGKTESARHHSKSEVVVDDSPSIEIAMQSDPRVLLSGETPRLIDEWQEQPRLWNTVRHEVDRRRMKGQFILTGSANPVDAARLHSGSGRFGVINMRTMTWHELGWSTGEVSLSDIFLRKEIGSDSYAADLFLTASRLVIGGWPGHLDLGADEAGLGLSSYLELLAEVDLSRVSQARRDPIKIRRLLQSLARNTATECAVSGIAADTGGADGSLSENTVKDYLEALSRLMVVDDLPAWSPHIRSRARLRKSAKRHFADASLAAAALGMNTQGLLHDLQYMGFLFESLVIHDLRAFAESNGAKVFHYRDSNGIEADAIWENRDGSWAAFEIKLGFGGADQAAHSLLKLRETVDADQSGKPLALIAVTGSGFAHRRSDGVYVIPIQALGP